MFLIKKVIGGVLASNMYIINEARTTNCWIVDIGNFSKLESNLPKDAVVRGLFLTHGHFDHIAGINDFCLKFPEIKIYASEYTCEQLYSSKKNFSLYHEQPIVFEGDKSSITILQDGDKVALFRDFIIEVIATPGHCESCLTYYTTDYIFTGDAYIPNAQIVTKLPKGNKNKATESLSKIMQLVSGRVVCPGHDVETWTSIL